jgi:glucose/arabinose dehydrogenase
MERVTMHLFKHIVSVIIACFFFAGAWPQVPLAGIRTKMMLTAVQLPPGFTIALYADDVPGARAMALSPAGVLYVATRQNGRVYAVLDTNGDKRADKVIAIADGLHMPNGVAFRDGDLYVAEVGRILRFRQIESRLDQPLTPEVIYDRYPGEMRHGSKFIRFGPDGRLYVPVGAPCNACLSDDQVFATITRINRDGSGFAIFAHGVRNSMGFDWHPRTGELWFTDNGRAGLGDDLPPDELNRAGVAGLHFGFPHCHGGTVADPLFGNARSCGQFTQPAAALAPGVVASGMRFYTGRMFPETYHNQIFIAEHGSWDRVEKTGYRVTSVILHGDRVVSYTPFARGWLAGDVAWGRPVDVEVMGDGSLLVSDDQNGVIYRIAYAPPHARDQ